MECIGTWATVLRDKEMTRVRGLHAAWLESTIARGTGPNGWIEPEGAMRGASRAGRGTCRTQPVLGRSGADRVPLRAASQATNRVTDTPFAARSVTVESWVRGRFERRKGGASNQR